MKKIHCPLIVLSLIAGPAFAADVAPLISAAPAPVYSWAGLYVGFNAGWLGSASKGVTNTGTDTGAAGLGSLLAAGAIPTSLNRGYDGFMGGGQLGYNWQTGSWVYGIETDIQGAGTKSTATVGPVTVAKFAPITTTYTREIDWFSTFRGRLGVAVVPSLLLYGTGGLAVGQTKIANGFVCPPACATPFATTNQTSSTPVGWTAGLGAEWMFAPNWSVKAEYLYVDLGSHSSTITFAYPPNTSSLTSTVHDTVNVVRGGFNYKF
jgi:outer membrane immunogenic protein